MGSQGTFTVVITDSGIGGVGIAADLHRALKTRGPHTRAKIIFYNSLFDAQSGYNILKDMDEKVAIFDTALQGMLQFEPDVLLLGSNTLSVLYEKTAFARSAQIPVTGLLDLGVRHILDQSGDDRSGSALILFATPLTVEEGVFRSRLSKHFSHDQMVELACTGLEQAIGDGDLPTINQLIDRYVDEALQKIPKGSRRVYASLHCTHFGYYQHAFQTALNRLSSIECTVLNPNAALAHSLLQPGVPPAQRADVDIRFVSKVHFNPDGVRSLMGYVTAISPEAGRAFEAYEYVPDLF